MHSRVIVPGVVEVVADGSGQQDAQVLLAHLLPQTAELNHAVHHLTHAEAVAEVVERVVSVVLLYAQLATQTITAHKNGSSGKHSRKNDHRIFLSQQTKRMECEKSLFKYL